MIYLVIVIVALCALIGWMEYNNRKERKTMLNAILAKNHQELVNLNLADKTEIRPEVEEELPPFEPVESLSDEDFMKAIKND